MDGLGDVLTPPPRASACLPTAIIRTAPEDFAVCEIPAYTPCGDGEHLFLQVEKRGLASRELVRRISRHLQIADRDIGIAGQKDRHAVTRQWVSVPRSCLPRLAELEPSGIRVLQAVPHTNKLKTGHLRGNAFRLTIRPDSSRWDDADRQAAQRRLERLAADGMPNYFGPQRFGHHASTFHRGLQLLTDARPPRTARWLKRLAFSAVQAAVFNQVTALRVRAGTLTIPRRGDVVIRRGGSRPFLFDGEPPADPSRPQPSDEATPQPRLIPAGPLPGPDMLQAGHDVGQQEQDILRAIGIREQDFARAGRLGRGTRRAMAVFPESVSADLTADGSLELRFTLPAGSFATILLNEIFGQVVDASAQQDPGSAAEPGESGLSEDRPESRHSFRERSR